MSGAACATPTRSWRTPNYDKGAIIIVRNGKAGAKGAWQLEQRDVVADYARAFGQKPDLSKLRYLAISADTDDTGTVSSARVADGRAQRHVKRYSEVMISILRGLRTIFGIEFRPEDQAER